MSLLDFIPDPHTLEHIKRLEQRLDISDAVRTGTTSDASGLFIYSETEPQHPTSGTQLWVKTVVPWRVSISLVKGNGQRQWVQFAEARSS